VVGLTDNTGALTDTYSYTAFGEVRARTGTNTQPYQYLGNSYDSDSKLYDFHARAYDPSVGRFTSEDPVAGFAEAPQSLNPYAYGYNGPLAYPDPYGECPICVAALPVIGRAAAAAGKVVAADAATNAVISSGGYYLNHRADKGDIDWADFRRTVGQETLDQTLSDFKNPLNFLPSSKLERVSEVLKFADEANDARKRVDDIWIGKHVQGQMSKRGWTETEIEDIINHPVRTVPTRDTRHLPGGGRMDDSATGYVRSDGSYVIRNDRTGDIVQVSNRNDPNWRAPWDR